MKSYKAFNKDYICRDYKFDIHKTNVCEGDIEICYNGFHSCPDPHNIQHYYNVKSKNTVFAIVDVYGETDITIDDKIASRKLKIIKTFNTYDELLKEFEANNNQTIDFIKRIKEGPKRIANISREELKEIIYSTSPQNTYAKLIFFSMLTKTIMLTIINALEDFNDLIRFAAVGCDNKDEIICDIVDKQMKYKDLVHRLSRKDQIEFNTLVKAFNAKSDMSFKTLTEKKIRDPLIIKPMERKINLVTQSTYERKV